MSGAPGSASPTPLVVDVVELRRHTGTRRPFRLVARLDDLVAGEFAVVDDELDLDLVIEAVAEGIVVAGVAAGRWRGPCRRCLEEIVRSFEVDLHEVFERLPTEGETWPLEEERIDLAPMLREAALLALPLAPLCEEGCAGPAPERFPTAAPAEGDGGEPSPDPRWAALDGIRFDD